MANQVVLDAPLLRMPKFGMFLHDSPPPVSIDAEACGHSEETIEDSSHALGVPARMHAVDSDLANWVRRHGHLCPLRVEDGESRMVLLFQ